MQSIHIHTLMLLLLLCLLGLNLNDTYYRYGRTMMELKLKELFGENMHEIGRQGGEITYAQFVESVDRVQLNMFLDTNVGRRAKGFRKEKEARRKKDRMT